MSVHRTLALVLGVVMLAAGAVAQPSGGASLHETGGPDMGSSYAGAGARAQDATTAWLNPAGLTRLEGNQLVSGLGLAWADVSLELEAPGTISVPPGNLDGGGHSGSLFPILGSYASISLSDRLKAGLAVVAPFGGGVDYSENWVGRTSVTENLLAGVLMQPTAAFRVTDWLSVGAGVTIGYLNFEQQLKASDSPLAPTIEISDAEDWGVGANIGILLEPWQGGRVGVTYVTEVTYELEGSLENPTTMTPSFGLDLTFPHSIEVSLYQEITPEVALLLDVGWSDWSSFAFIPIQIGDRVKETADLNWHDTWRIGVGGQWQVNDDLRVRAGWSYDSSSVDAEDVLAFLPAGAVNRISAGAEYRFNERITAHISYTAAILDWEIDHVPFGNSGGMLDGEYDPSVIHFIGFSFNLELGRDPEDASTEE